ncbi:prenyl protein peptidase [Geosmithia morbida]|uniref:intramembrane prenyl-peptidase Rce1 n=1 Tax=Geosmithia morbida TaxID=1094350 RepID=A0A9P4YQN2_9HYPO|nr:prenyl protein peptidase [Geosmithia morbida]KAF4120265.1 prenyl protein peptidase [Geosmithia morbida]
MSAEAVTGSQALSEAQAFGLLLAYCVVYVLPLHIYPAARAIPGRSRDDPAAIRARIRVVSLSTAACSLATLLFLLAASPAEPAAEASTTMNPWRLMGYWPPGLLETAKALALTALLFAAPLYEHVVVDGAWSRWLHLEPLVDVWVAWPSWRNYVAGPITEECLFRSASVPLLLSAGHTMESAVFLSPLVFGLAHVHHFYEFRQTNPQVPVIAALARSVLQFAYTYLFGIYATFIFLRTGSLLAVVLVHTFCNSMGLPRLWGHVEPYWYSWRELTDSTKPGPWMWTAIYYFLLFGGVMTFYRQLYLLSESPLALADF